MSEDYLAARFEENRAHLHSVAYRMLGNHADAQDAVQNCWLRLASADTRGVDNLAGWLTTVVARECLHTLRARRTHPEQTLPDSALEQDQYTSDRQPTGDPEAAALLADQMGAALMVVLDTLTPGERVAFVLHDVFAVPFDEIARILERGPAATRQLASRARRRVHGATPARNSDLTRQRRVVDAFLAALTYGDLAGLIAVLDPDVTLHDDSTTLPPDKQAQLHGAEAVAARAASYSWGAGFARPALIEGTVGLALAAARGRILGALRFTIDHDKITRIDVISNPDRLRHTDVDSLHA